MAYEYELITKEWFGTSCTAVGACIEHTWLMVCTGTEPIMKRSAKMHVLGRASDFSERSDGPFHPETEVGSKVGSGPHPPSHPQQYPHLRRPSYKTWSPPPPIHTKSHPGVFLGHTHTVCLVYLHVMAASAVFYRGYF